MVEAILRNFEFSSACWLSGQETTLAKQCVKRPVLRSLCFSQEIVAGWRVFIKASHDVMIRIVISANENWIVLSSLSSLCDEHRKSHGRREGYNYGIENNFEVAIRGVTNVTTSAARHSIPRRLLSSSRRNSYALTSSF